MSTDTDASIPVLLPNVQTEVRLTRSEFEGMIRPALGDSIAAMRRALRSAEVEPAGVASVLLVGGSSRIPLVAQMVGAELGRPVAVDAHPKHAIALGAALAAAQAGGMTGSAGPVPADAGTDDIAGAAAAGAGVGAVAGAVVGAAGASEVLTGAGAPAPSAAPPVAEPPAAPVPEAPAPQPAPTEAQPVVAASEATHVEVPPQPEPVAQAAAPSHYAAPPSEGTPPPGERKADKGVPSGLIYGGILLIVLLVAGGAYLLTQGGDDGGDTASTVAATDSTSASSDTTASTDPPVTEPAGVTETVACDTSGGFLGCIEDVTVDDANNAFIVTFDTDFTASNGGMHYHFFLNPPTSPSNAGQNGNPPGSWFVHFGGSPAQVGQSNQTPSDARANGSTELCARVANSDHTFVEGTGNCVSIADLL